MESEKIVYKSVPQQNENGDTSPPVYEAPKGIGNRHIQAFILFMSLTVGFLMRAQLSVSLVAMTSHQNTTCDLSNTLEVRNLTNSVETNQSATKRVAETVCEDAETLKPWTVYRTYNWDKPTQEMILFSFFVGYTSMMLPMGFLVQRYGGKIPFMVALGVNGVLSILTPWLPLFGGWTAVCVCRLLQGSTQASFFPSIHTILGRWAPLAERGRLSTYIYTGSQFGTTVAFQVAGVLAGSPSLGWPATFWLSGVASLACCAMLAWLGAATPHEHPTISAEELAYITSDSSADAVPQKRAIPWKHILRSRPVWGMMLGHAGSTFGYLFVLTQIPLYMDKILNVDIKKNGLYSSLPYIAMYLMSLVSGWAADCCLNRRILSLTNIRRVANTIGLVASGAFLAAFVFVDSTPAAVACLVMCLGLHSGTSVGFHINAIDLAPNFAGPLMALSNMTGNLVGLLLPVLVSNIVGNDETNQHKWQILFLLVVALQVLANCVFVALVSGVAQPWNYYGIDTKNASETPSEKETITFKSVASS